MTADAERGIGPGQARLLMDELEAVIHAESREPGAHAGGSLHGDWEPTVPGCEEPPD